MRPELKVSRGVTKLAFSHPFFGSLLLSCGHKRDDTMPTMYTQGTYVGWNGNFVDTLTEDHTRTILAHEVLHIVFGHCQPWPGKDPKMCNISMDYVINAILNDDGMSFPEGCLYDPMFAGMTWQKVYDILADIYEKKQQKDGNLTGDWDNPNDDGSIPVTNDGKGNGKPMKEQEGNGSGAAERAEIDEEKQQELGDMLENQMFNPDLSDVIENSDMTEEQKEIVKQKVLQAAQAHKSAGCGNLASAIEDLIDEIRTSKVDWVEYLHETMLSNYPEDYTFRRPNKKFMGAYDMYMPTMEGVQVGNIGVHVDFSGSVSMDERIEFLSEINEISVMFNPEKIYIFYTDCEVHKVEVFESGDEVTALDGVGGGGTSFTPTFDYIEKEGIELDQLLVFSDMEVWEACFPKEEPDYPTLFISTRKHYDVPFGECITTGGA